MRAKDAELQSTRQTLEQQARAFAAERAELEERLAEKDTKLHGLWATLASTTTELSAKEQQAQAFAAERAELGERLAETDTKLQTLTSAHAELEGKFQNALSEAEGARTKLAEELEAMRRLKVVV